ncbi:MAG TPA: hypothetical protein VGE98_11075, partial [Thermoanaerobaculia bacterium]
MKVPIRHADRLKQCGRAAKKCGDAAEKCSSAAKEFKSAAAMNSLASSERSGAAKMIRGVPIQLSWLAPKYIGVPNLLDLLADLDEVDAATHFFAAAPTFAPALPPVGAVAPRSLATASSKVAGDASFATAGTFVVAAPP